MTRDAARGAHQSERICARVFRVGKWTATTDNFVAFVKPTGERAADEDPLGLPEKFANVIDVGDVNAVDNLGEILHLQG